MAYRFISIFSTSFGEGAVYASEQGILKVDLPDMSKVSVTIQKTVPDCNSSRLTEYTAGQLQKYFRGEAIEFKEIPVDLAGLTAFRSKALHVIRNITYGTICSYGQVAVECGSPAAVRAVGSAMASNPVPIIIPCHRIVGKNGSMKGFSAPGGETVKIMLLKMEGVEFKGLLASQKQLVMNR